jgi:hypothetical protein
MSVPASFYSTNTSVLLLNTASASGTLILPKTLSTINRVLTFKDRVGTSYGSTLTLTCSSGDTFENGASSWTLNQNFGEATFLAGADEKWYNIGGTYSYQSLISSLYTSTIFGTGKLLTGITYDTDINSTIAGLSSTYITVPDLTSTVTSLNLIGGSVVSENLTSTVAGLATTNYISSTQLQSTVTGISSFISTFTDVTELRSSVAGLANASYVSTATLSNALRSTVAGFGTAGYLSTLTSLSNTAMAIADRTRVSSFTAYTLSTNVSYTSTILTDELRVLNGTSTIYTVLNNSTLLVNGSNFLSNYVPTSGLYSTASALTYISTSALTSTVTGFLGNVSTAYYTTTELASSVTGLRTAGYLSTIVTATTSTINVSTNAIISTLTTQNLSSAIYLASTIQLTKYLQTSNTSTFAFTVANNSTLLINGTDVFSGYVLNTAIPSTASGQTYISTAALVSTTDGLRTYASSMIDVTEIASTVVGLGTAEYISSGTLDVALQSTVVGLGTAQYVSSQSYTSTFAKFLASPISSMTFTYQSTIATDTYVTNSFANYGSSFFNGSTIFTEIPTLNNSPLITLNQFISTISSLFAQPVVEHTQTYSF